VIRKPWLTEIPVSYEQLEIMPDVLSGLASGDEKLGSNKVSQLVNRVRAKGLKSKAETNLQVIASYEESGYDVLGVDTELGLSKGTRTFFISAVETALSQREQNQEGFTALKGLAAALHASQKSDS